MIERELQRGQSLYSLRAAAKSGNNCVRERERERERERDGPSSNLCD